MKNNRFLFTVAAVAAILASASCNRTLPDVNPGTTDSTVVTVKSKPVFKGTGYTLMETTEDLTMYSTGYKDEYSIPGYFKGIGELLFFWDRTTNIVTLEESFTAMVNEGYPIYIMSQNQYKAFKGDNAKNSFYEPVDKKFYFDVVMETADDDGMVYVETVMTFKVLETVE